MTWTYSNAPSSVNRDAVRYLVGQTSSGDDVLVTDEEITYTIAQTNNNYEAAALTAEALAARYRQAGPQSETIGQLSVTWGDRASQLTALAKTLRARSAVFSVSPFLGGQSETDRDGRQDDSDLRQPAFRVEQFDYQGSTGSTG